MQKLFIFILLSMFLVSCGEEVLTQNTLSTSYTASDLQGFELNTCAQMHFDKPPVDILFIVDNSGSSLLPKFAEIKSQIANTINTISSDFDYHIYVAPLIALQGDSLQGYPLLVSDTSTLNNTALNIVTPNSLQFFSQATGGTDEHGFVRATALINANKTNGIFRSKANTVVVTISNGDDNSATQTLNGQPYYNSTVFNNAKNELLAYSALHGGTSSLQAESFRYLTLVAHSNCNGYKAGYQYKKMSNEIYAAMNYNDDSNKNSYNLCSNNFTSLFSSINNSIRAVVVGHKYNKWKISNANPGDIQLDDLTVTKILADGSSVNISAGTVNGYSDLDFFTTPQNTRYEPTAGEPKTGLLINLNGTARVTYPECIIAKTRTPTEYYGFLALPREPQTDSIKVIIRGQEISQDSTNGWGYIGWKESQNIKVTGPTNVPITPAVYKSGYFIKLFGSAIFTNGDTIEVYYKPASL